MATQESIKQPNGGSSNTLISSGKYDPTTGFYIQDASGRAIGVRDQTGRLLSQDEEADFVRRGEADKLNTTWEQINQPKAAAPQSDAGPAPVAPPTPPPSTPAAAVAAPAAAPPALQQLGAPPRDGGAGLQEGGMTPLDSGLGARMLPASSRALAALARQRGGRVY